MLFNQVTRSQWLGLIILIISVSLYAAPSLGFGLVWEDDFEIMQAKLWQPRSQTDNVFWRFLYWRPVTMLSFSLTSAISDGVLAQRLVNLILFDLCIVLAFTLVAHHRFWPLILLAAFFHPSFIYPLTWIAQRNDLLLIIFSILALANIDRRRGLLYLALSDMAKTPFGFHNLLFAFHAWRQQSSPSKAILCLLLLSYVIFGGYFTYYKVNVESEVKHGAYLFADSGSFSWIIILLSRGLKFLENWIMVFVPFSATYRTVLFFPVVLLYLLIWAIVIKECFRGGTKTTRRVIYVFTMALLMSLPFVFGTGLRIVGPVVVFTYIGLFTIVQPTRLVKVALIGLFLLNLVGSVLHYRVTDTRCYDLPNESVHYDPVAHDGNTLCRWRQSPNQAWGKERQLIVDKFVHKIKNLMDN